jgi:hypothetical protein
MRRISGENVLVDGDVVVRNQKEIGTTTKRDEQRRNHVL